MGAPLSSAIYVLKAGLTPLPDTLTPPAEVMKLREWLAGSTGSACPFRRVCLYELRDHGEWPNISIVRQIMLQNVQRALTLTT